MGIVSRWEYNKRRLLCIINTTKKLVFLLILVCSLFVLLLPTTKGWWERKRNETRFDTITVSLKAIWLVLCFNLISATGVFFRFRHVKNTDAARVCVPSPRVRKNLRNASQVSSKSRAPLVLFHLQSNRFFFSRASLNYVSLCWICFNALTVVTFERSCLLRF